MKIKKILKEHLVIIALAILSSLIFTQIAGAAYSIPQELKPDNAPMDLNFTSEGSESGTNALLTVIQIIAGALLYFAAPLAIIAIGMIAFNMAMGSGSQEKIEAQKKNLTWAILGLLTIITSYALIKILIGFVFQTFDSGTTN